MPYLRSLLAVSLTIRASALHIPFQHILEPQLVFFIVKLSVVFVQRVVSQMHKGIIVAFGVIILLTR